jgi:DNA-binding NtrC family response regulator
MSKEIQLSTKDFFEQGLAPFGHGRGLSELSGLNILIVEDSWDVSAGLKMLVEAWGASVVGQVASANEARCLVAERAPDVALVDIHLRNGERSYALIDQLHEQGIRVVVITGYAEVSRVKEKAAAILQKPIREKLLLTCLRSARQSLHRPVLETAKEQ